MGPSPASNLLTVDAATIKAVIPIINRPLMVLAILLYMTAATMWRGGCRHFGSDLE